MALTDSSLKKPLLMLLDMAGRKAGYTLPTHARLRRNNFDLLRFLLALTVFLYHGYVLSDAPALSIFNHILSADLAVKSFFIVSGFLIFMSYENSRDIRSYFVKRAKRIYPAYFFMILAGATLGLIFTSHARDGFFFTQLLKYVASNLVFLNVLQPSVPGLFDGNRLQAINGALWTLKIEVMFYLFVPLAVLAFRQLGRLPMMALFFVGSVLYSMIMLHFANQTGLPIYLELQRQLPGQIAFFIAGAATYYYFDKVTRYAVWLVPLGLIAFALQDWLPWLAVEPLALAVLVIGFACLLPHFGDFAKYGDFSYGMYIAHFPILQLLIAYGFFRHEPWSGLLLAAALVLSTAFLLWHWVEKPFLRKSSHYVVVKNVDK
ncbi:MAG: acyltransferase family protein [Sulfuriferula sp.]